MSAFTKLLQKSAEFCSARDHIASGNLPLGVLGLSGVHKAHWISAILFYTY